LFLVNFLSLASDQFYECHLRAVAPPCSQFQDAGVSAGSLGKSSRHLIEKLIERSHARCARGLRTFVATIRHAIGVPAEEVSRGQPAIMKSAGRYVGCKSTFAERNGSLGKWPKLFSFG